MKNPGQSFSTRRLLLAYYLPRVLQGLRAGQSYRDAHAALARNGLHVARGTLYTYVCQYRHLLQDTVAGEVARQVQKREAAALAAQRAAQRATQEAHAARQRAEQAQEEAERAVNHARRRARNAMGAAKRIQRRLKGRRRMEADLL